MERKLIKLEIEKLSVQNDIDASTRLPAIENEIKELTKQKTDLQSQYNVEMDLVAGIQSLKEQIDRVKVSKYVRDHLNETVCKIISTLLGAN